MNISKLNYFIPQNIAPYEASKIGIYNRASGVKVGDFSLQHLKFPRLGAILYRFGALADIHLQYETAQTDFENALTYLEEVEKVAFTGICGDLTDNGEESDFEAYAELAKKFNIFECTGNHDVQTTALTKEGLKPYTGHELYYSFEQGNDIFIMFGMSGWLSVTGETFSTESLQWLYETLEANRNKRCIVFQHCLRFDGSGKPYEPNMTGNLLNCTSGSVFISLMEHYTNVIWFHGHSHMKFECQEDTFYANYDRMYGCHSVHIPSLAVPRAYVDSQYVQMFSESEGYVVDMYENHMVLRGRDFVKEKFLPIATYCIDTTLVNILAGTYTDSTGTITT